MARAQLMAPCFFQLPGSPYRIVLSGSKGSVIHGK